TTGSAETRVLGFLADRGPDAVGELRVLNQSCSTLEEILQLEPDRLDGGAGDDALEAESFHLRLHREPRIAHARHPFAPYLLHRREELAALGCELLDRILHLALAAGRHDEMRAGVEHLRRRVVLGYRYRAALAAPQARLGFLNAATDAHGVGDGEEIV